MASRYTKTRTDGVLFREVVRRDGTGTVRQYAIQYRDPAGKQHMEVVGRGDEGMTPAKASRIRAEKQTGKMLPNVARREEKAKDSRMGDGPVTLRKVFQLYDEDRAERKSRRCDVRLVPHVGAILDKPAMEITTADVEAMKRRLRSTYRKDPLRGERKLLSPQTVALVAALVKRILRHAVAMGYLASLPAGLTIKVPRVDNMKTETMDGTQMAAYFHALDVDPDRLGSSFLRLILCTGLRRTAALNLRWDDVITTPNGMVLRLRGDVAKSKKTRFIPLNEAAQAVLNSIPHTDSPFIFMGPNGEHRSGFRTTADRIKKAAGLPADWRPVHSLRHVFASFLVSNGATLFQVQTLLTQDTPSVTLRYAHLQDESLKRATELANSMPGLEGPSKS